MRQRFDVTAGVVALIVLLPALAVRAGTQEAKPSPSGPAAAGEEQAPAPSLPLPRFRFPVPDTPSTPRPETGPFVQTFQDPPGELLQTAPRLHCFTMRVVPAPPEVDPGIRRSPGASAMAFTMRGIPAPPCVVPGVTLGRP